MNKYIKTISYVTVISTTALLLNGCAAAGLAVAANIATIAGTGISIAGAANQENKLKDIDNKLNQLVSRSHNNTHKVHKHDK